MRRRESVLWTDSIDIRERSPKSETAVQAAQRGASDRLCFDFPHRRSITLLAKQRPCPGGQLQPASVLCAGNRVHVHARGCAPDRCRGVRLSGVRSGRHFLSENLPVLPLCGTRPEEKCHQRRRDPAGTGRDRGESSRPQVCYFLPPHCGKTRA